MSITEKELEKVQKEALGALETVSSAHNMELLTAKMEDVTYAFKNNAKLTTVTRLEEMEKIINRMKGILILENKTDNF